MRRATGVPATVREITPDWLATAVGPGIADAGAVEAVRIGERYGFFSELYRIAVTRNGQPVSLVVKLWSTEGLAGDREVPFYRDFGGDAGIRIPRCHHGAIDPDARRGILVLEDVRDGVQGDCLEILDAGRAAVLAEQLAELHARWWASPRLPGAGWLPSAARYVREADWLEQRRSLFLSRFERELRPACRRVFESAASVQDRSNLLLSRVPETLIHGDFHLDNLILQPDGRAVVLDWARVARGPGVLDLCEVVLMARPADAEPILDRYLAGLRRSGVVADVRDLADGVTGALLRKFLSCTYGVANWRPATPREDRILHAFIARAQDALLTWTPPGVDWGL